jgi:hypothetical protein
MAAGLDDELNWLEFGLNRTGLVNLAVRLPPMLLEYAAFINTIPNGTGKD